MQHKRDFEELFKEKYSGPIIKSKIQKTSKMEHTVLNKERIKESKFHQGKH